MLATRMVNFFVRRRQTTSFNETDTRLNKYCKYNASNKGGNSNTKRVLLFWPALYCVATEWRFGSVGNVVGRINEVNQRRARSELSLATRSGPGTMEDTRGNGYAPVKGTPAMMLIMGTVSTWMGDRLQAGKPSWYVTSHPGQLNLAITSREYQRKLESKQVHRAMH